MNLRPALLTFVALAMFAAGLAARAAAPVVFNVRSAQRAGTQLLEIDYDLADPDSATLAVTVAVSTNGGASYYFPATSFSGALGNSVSPGAGQRITWNAGQDWPNKFSANVGLPGGAIVVSQRVQAFLQAFLEGAPDGHRFAHAFHLRGERGAASGCLLRTATASGGGRNGRDDSSTADR